MRLTDLARPTDTADPMPADAQPTTPAAPVAQVRDLSVVFKTPGGDVEAVNDVGFDLGAREILAIVGESGSGKSVLLRALTALLPANAERRGRVVVDGIDVDSAGRKMDARLRGRAAGMIFQDPLGTLDALASIGMQLEQAVVALTALPRRAARHRALELLERVHFPNPKQRYGAYPHELSGGQLQRVGIALALAGNPKVLLADEPTTALDVSVQSRILALLRELRDDVGAAIVLVTHDIGVAGQMADRLAVMYAGRWVEHGPAEAVLSRPRHPYTRAIIGSYSGVRRGLRPLPHLKGAPPNRYATHPRQGCPLAPRCPEALSRCSGEAPPERQRDGSVSVCWLDR